MSFWGKLAGIGLGVAGVFTGQPELIAAGVGQVVGDQANETAKKATQQQVASGRDALALQKEIYGQTTQNQSPYLQVGRGALANLAGMTGLPPMDVAGAVPPVASMAAPRAAPEVERPNAREVYFGQADRPLTLAQLGSASSYARK